MKKSGKMGKKKKKEDSIGKIGKKEFERIIKRCLIKWVTEHRDELREEFLKRKREK